MTLIDALILSYVKRGIGYGYNILEHVKESRSDEWVEFSRAGLYKTLDKLEKAGYLKKNLDQNGSRPPRKTYRITPSGEQALMEYLNNGFNCDYQTKNELDAYLVTAVAASRDVQMVAATIRKRISSVRKQITILTNEWPEDKNAYPFVVYALYKRRMEFLESEIQWLTWFENVIQNKNADILHATWAEVQSEI